MVSIVSKAGRREAGENTHKHVDNIQHSVHTKSAVSSRRVNEKQERNGASLPVAAAFLRFFFFLIINCSHTHTFMAREKMQAS